MAAMLALEASMISRAGVRRIGSFPMYPSTTIMSRERM